MVYHWYCMSKLVTISQIINYGSSWNQKNVQRSIIELQMGSSIVWSEKDCEIWIESSFAIPSTIIDSTYSIVLINSIKQLGSNIKHLINNMKHNFPSKRKFLLLKHTKKIRIKEVSQKWKPLKQ